MYAKNLCQRQQGKHIQLQELQEMSFIGALELLQKSLSIQYASKLWDPHQQCLIKTLETVQHHKQSHKPQAKKIITEEQAGFRAERSATEQIFNLRILCEEYIQHQQDLYHVFIDFKKAFGRVWHAALCATMKKYNINANLIRVIKHLPDKATSAVLFNGSIGDWFRTTVGVDTHQPP